MACPAGILLLRDLPVFTTACERFQAPSCDKNEHVPLSSLGLSTINPRVVRLGHGGRKRQPNNHGESVTLTQHWRIWATEDAVSGCEQSSRLLWKTESDRLYFAGGALAFLFLKTGMGASSL